MPKSNNEYKRLRQNRVLNFILNYPGEYSMKDIALMFDVSSKTISDTYAKEFEKLGIEIFSRKKRCQLEEVIDEVQLVERKYTKEDMKKFLIWTFIKNEFKKNVSKKRFIDRFVKDEEIMKSEDYVYKLLSKMKKDNLIKIERGIIKNKENIIFNLNKEELKKLLLYLNIVKDINPKKSRYKNIFKKLKMLFNEFDNSIITINNLNGLSSFDEYIAASIERAVLTQKMITFKYVNDKKVTQYKIIPVGIIYSHVKDQWYLNGEKLGKRKRRESMLFRLDKILDLKVDKENGQGIFKKEDFQKSVGISEEKTVEVKVEFENEEFIERKVKAYIDIRKNAVLKKEKDKLILIDEVNGTNEFESWVRSFGKSAKCIYPEKLVNNIQRNIKLLKERYEINE